MPSPGVMILAAGGSTRMGRPKQLLRIQETSLLRKIVLTAIDSEVGPVLVVLGHRAEEMKRELDGLPVLTAINPSWNKGIGSSIRCGVDQLIAHMPGVDSVMILLGDQPLIRPDHLRSLADAHKQTGRPVCVSAFGGTTGPPVLICGSFFDRLSLLDDAHGARHLWSDQSELVCQVPCEEAATDIDTPADYSRLIMPTRVSPDPLPITRRAAD